MFRFGACSRETGDPVGSDPRCDDFIVMALISTLTIATNPGPQKVIKCITLNARSLKESAQNITWDKSQ